MGIKVDIGSADSQGSTANSVLSSRVNYYNDVITAFNNLITEGELKGKAYDSAKFYAENIMVPLLRGVILFSESLGGKASELPTLYRSQVGGESLDEEILQKQIEAKNTTISTHEAILYSLSNLKDIDPTYKSNVRGIISNATSKRDELQRKLEKLQSFASSTSGHFSDSESLQTLVFQGFEQVTGDFGKFDGTFKVEGQAPWANTINNEWTKRSEVIQNYQNVLDKIKNKTELDENDIAAIAEYGKRYPTELAKPELLRLINDSPYSKVSELYNKTTTVLDVANVLYLGSRISKDNKGNLIFHHGTTPIGQKLDKLLGYDKFYSRNSVNRNYNYSKITTNKGTNIRGQYEDMMSPFRPSIIKAGKDGALSSATAGLSNIFSIHPTEGIKISDSFKNMGKLGKGMAIANVAFSAVDIVDGMGETHDIAVSKNMTVGSGEYITTQFGGVTIDTLKNVGIGTLATVGGAAAATIFLPATASVMAIGGVTMLVGGGISWGLNELDKHTGFSKGLKKWWAGIVGG
ncbi:LXG domain-containing protein [Streptococcus oralis]|uniref:T7SS effector LXG polymorphic toxin n=1 Tax=Streptococcus oralis TaxID=1303 RepID=UPI001CBC7A7A|nr:T7SS effector LXG polymorphic toxin [Streptococcus oralis]MBZ2086967.1 LXG domain-containing protein [Streptococcus oralis]